MSSSEICIHWPSIRHVQVRLILFPFCTKEEAKAINVEKCTSALIFHNCLVSKSHARFCSICDFVSSSLLSNQVRFTDANTEFRDFRQLSHRADKSQGQGLNLWLPVAKSQTPCHCAL